MKLILIRILKKIIQVLGLENKHIYILDGGLGSQLITYLAYLSDGSKNKLCDVSFFENIRNSKVLDNNTFREYNLNEFGIPYNKLKRTKLPPKIFNPTLKTRSLQIGNFLASFDKTILDEIDFPSFSGPYLFDKYGLKEINNLCTVHLRRGDFRTQASYMVPDKNFLDILKKLKELKIKDLLILSDEVIEVDFLKNINKYFPNENLITIIGGNEIEAHYIMRMSKILVLSNSMFSLSAALTSRKNQISISPHRYYSSEFWYFNKAIIDNISEWKIMKF